MENLLGQGAAIASIALDAAMLRHQAIASNIANAGTPGYTPLRVNFEEQLAAAAGEGDAANLKSVTPFIEHETTQNGLTPQVALDMEIVKLNVNTVHYQALTRMVSKYASIMNAAITEGRR